MKKILLADDNYENLLMLKHIFENDGYIISEARDGFDILDKASKEFPDLILLDIEMPKINGYEVCLRLKSDNGLKTIPVIFLSEHSEIVDIVTGFKLGGADYITKPFIPEELLVRVKTVISISEMINDVKKQNAQLLKISRIDALTGLFNRRYFLEVSTRELIRAKRYNHALSLLMIDVDHFKSINDTFGHHAGDQVLRSIGSICQKILRCNDIMGRIGGEEFSILLIEANITEAKLFAGRFLREISKNPVVTDMGKIFFTVSIGVAKDNEQILNVEDLMKKADIALYRAKGNGRNMVEIFNKA